MDFEQINIWAVLLAALAKFILGGLWYSPVLFGNVWLRETGLKADELTAPAKPIILAAALGLVTALTLSVIIMLARLDFVHSLALGSLIGIGIMAAMLGPQFAFEGRSFRLYTIYAGQYMVELIMMAAIIGAFQ